MSYAVCDLEATGFLFEATKIHCICWVDDEGREFSYSTNVMSNGSVEAGLAKLQSYDTVVFHNANGYDLPLIKKLYGITFKHTVDTMIWSRMLAPDRLGGHSIEQYAKEMGMTKVGKDITDWSILTDEMLDRCLNDAKVGMKVYEKLKPLITDNWKEAVDLEERVATLHSQQVLNGVEFDMVAANDLADEMDRRLIAIRGLILEGLPLEARQYLSTIKQIYLRNGSLTKKVKQWSVDNSVDVWGCFTRVVFEKLNIDSPIKVKEYLLTQGWIPLEFTPKGSPILTENSYHTIQGEMGRLLAKKNVLTHRRNMVRYTNKKGDKKGFVSKVRSDGRIAAEAITLGAATGRYAHKVVANLPRVTTSYGKEIRALFCVPKGKVQIGWDLSGIENRIAAHYLYPADKGKFARQVLEAPVVNGVKIDFHQMTADANGITRDEAKTFRYMTLYGASPTRIAATMGWAKKKAAKVYSSFWKQEYLLKKMSGLLEKAAKSTGSIKGLDGRRLTPRSTHAMLNFLFQSAATIVFKRAVVILMEKLEGLDCLQTITYHDEVQMEAYEEDVEEIAWYIHEACEEAGKFYGLKVPIECEIKKGRNWAECH